jgi:hypothetical protein
MRAGENFMRKRDTASIVLLVLSSFITLCGIGYFCFLQRHLWETITGVATVWIVFVAYTQLVVSNATSKADFIRRFTIEGRGENITDLMTLILGNAITYNVEGQFFNIDEKTVRKLGIDERKKTQLIKRQRYSQDEISSWLLGWYEEMASFEKNDIITLDYVYDNFSFNLRELWKKIEIQKYVTSINEKETDNGGIPDLFEGVKMLVSKLENYEIKKKLALKFYHS